MQYFEFQNIFLPAANQSLRDMCLYRRVPSYLNDPARPCAVSVASLTVRILENEIRYAKMLHSSRRELAMHADHNKHKTFADVSRGLSQISMSDLIFFNENNGFYPRTEDLEAILRRCDHDADRCLSFEEFNEVTELPGAAPADDLDESRNDKASPLRSNSRMEEERQQ